MEWISVKDRLPEPNVEVLVSNDRGVYCMTHQFHKGDWFPYGASRDVGYVTHWMPLPEPPKQLKDNQ